MAKYIDDHVYTDDCDDVLVFKYIYFLISMLAYQAQYFKSAQYYDDFALSGASRVFMRLRNPKQFEVDENGKNIRGTGHMVFDWFEWEKDGKEIPKIHPAQKPVKLMKKLIETFTDPCDVVIDPCFGSGSTARAALETGRNFYGFEINKEFYRRAKEEMIVLPEDAQMTIEDYLKGEKNV
jgi:DNA modification methylase